MRRFFILFMLCLLPVQISWAAVADYCAEPTGDTQHFAPAADQHATLGEAFDGELSDNGVDPVQSIFGHDHCHLSGFIGLLSEATLSTAIVPPLPVLQRENHVFSSQILDRPERPKWYSLA